MRNRLALALAFAFAFSADAADELSGADKLRVVYSNQFAWTPEGLPIIPVRIAEGLREVVITAPDPLGGVRVLPDGDGGGEVRGGATWTVRVQGGKPGKVRWHVVVARLAPGDERIQAEMATWRGRGFSPRTFETGTVIGMKGEVLDSRRVLVTLAPQDPQSPQSDEAQARAQAAELGARFKIDAGVHPELYERPRGVVEATDERGTLVRNDAILWFQPAPNGLLELKDVDKEGGGRESRRYLGRLYATVDRAGALAVVNAVPEDKLLAGLVPAEMMPSAPAEALKAQAVAARNELYAKIGTRHLTDPYRVCATQHCQVYAGAGREDVRSTQAVTATQGELLLRESGGLIDTVYSASCGGHTEDNDRAWGTTPDAALRGKPDGDPKKPWCSRPKGAQSSFRWEKPIPVGALSAVEILDRGVSGRVVRLRLVGAGGAKEVRGELEVRRALSNLKSARFTLTERRDDAGRIVELHAAGSGHGHGVGMCQMGAVGLAESGARYQDILRHYYGPSVVRRMY